MEDPLYIWFELKAAQAKGESVSGGMAKASRKLCRPLASSEWSRTLATTSRSPISVPGAPAGWSIDGVGLHQGPVSQR